MGADVSTVVAVDAQVVQQRLFRPQEAHRQQDELDGTDLLGPRHFFGTKCPFVALPPHLHGKDLLHPTLVVPDKLGGGGEIDARVGAELCGGLFLAVVKAIDLRPLRPRVVAGAVHGRAREDFHLDQAPAAMPHRGSHAVRARVAASDDHHVLAVA